MSQRKAATAHAVLTSIAAHLFVSNVTVACDFFVQKLGFAVDFVYGEPPFYAEVSRDRALLALRFVHEPVFAAGVRSREQLLSASITLASTREIEALALEFKTAGVSFQQPLKTEPWGARTFVVADPDENLLLFAGPAEKRATAGGGSSPATRR